MFEGPGFAAVAAFVEGYQGAPGPLATIAAALGEEERARLRAEVAATLRPFEGREGPVVPCEVPIAVGTR